MKKIYFDRPTQVKFTENLEDDDVVVIHFGIAYHDEIICGCCGGIIEAENVDTIEELEWLPFEEYLRN